MRMSHDGTSSFVNFKYENIDSHRYVDPKQDYNTRYS